MVQTFKAITDEQGIIKILGGLKLPAKRKAIVTVLVEEKTPTQKLRPFSLCAGEFSVPKNFDDPLPESIIETFEGK